MRGRGDVEDVGVASGGDSVEVIFAGVRFGGGVGRVVVGGMESRRCFADFVSEGALDSVRKLGWRWGPEGRRFLRMWKGGRGREKGQEGTLEGRQERKAKRRTWMNP